MDVQQTNLLQSSPNPHTKLLDDRKSPSVESSFDKEENPSHIHQRVFISEQEALNGSLTMANTQNPHQGMSQSQLEELSPKFEAFYKAVMVGSLGISTGAVLWFLFTLKSESKPTPFDGLTLALKTLVIIQSIFAYQGFIKRDLQSIEHALNIMKASPLLMGAYLASKFAFALNKKKDKEGSFDYGFLILGVLMVGVYVFLIVLPTRKVRNVFKLAFQEENKRKRPDFDSFQPLDSPYFILIKYGHLIAACLGVKYLIWTILQDFSAETWEKMMSDWGFSISTIKRYLLFLLFIFFNFFLFEGIRRKNLEKIEIATKLMIIYFIGLILSNIVEGISLDNGQVVWKHEQSFWEFFNQQWSFVSWFFAIFLMGPFTARNLLVSKKICKR